MNIDPTRLQLASTHARCGAAIKPPKGDGWILVATHAVPTRWSDVTHTVHGALVVCIWMRPRTEAAP